VAGPHAHAKFHRCGFKNVGLQPPNRKIMVIFGIKLPQRETFGIHRKSWIEVHNYKSSVPSSQISPLSLLKCGLTAKIG